MERQTMQRAVPALHTPAPCRHFTAVALDMRQEDQFQGRHHNQLALVDPDAFGKPNACLHKSATLGIILPKYLTSANDTLRCNSTLVAIIHCVGYL